MAGDCKQGMWQRQHASVLRERDGSEVVPRVAQILKRRWDAVAS
jgi:hypothetical protein